MRFKSPCIYYSPRDPRVVLSFSWKQILTDQFKECQLGPIYVGYDEGWIPDFWKNLQLIENLPRMTCLASKVFVLIQIDSSPALPIELLWMPSTYFQIWDITFSILSMEDLVKWYLAFKFHLSSQTLFFWFSGHALDFLGHNLHFSYKTSLFNRIQIRVSWD